MKNKKEETFRNNFKKLEEILEKLESGIEDHSLEEIINNYQEGIKLINICRKKLDEAELKIEKISTEQEN